MRIAQVIVDIKSYSVDKVFDYLIPDHLDAHIGMRVVAPFGNRTIDGYIIKITDKPQQADLVLKEITSVSDIQFLNEELIELSEVFAAATASFRTSMLQAMLPKDVTSRKLQMIDVVTAIKKFDVPTRAKKQQEVLDFLMGEQLPVSLAFLRKVFGQAVIATMVKGAFFKLGQIEKQLVSDPEVLAVSPARVELRAEQQAVLETLIHGEKTGYVLRGVTGSGKTEVFLTYAEYLLKQDKNVLVLVPEIGLTPQMIDRFETRFGRQNIAILHSKLGTADRFEMWRKIKNKEIRIVLGTRSAVFAPLEAIGAIIVDEEHDTSYKQESLPSYNAKDIALWRAEYHQAKVIFASATPSLESYVRAKRGIFGLLELEKRVTNQQKQIEIVNMREYVGIEANRYFSQVLLDAMSDALANEEQVMLLLNRRGYAPLVQCQHCGHTPQCEHCDTNLVYHKDKHKFICHYCQHEEAASFVCPACGAQMVQTGVGIQKIAEELETHFPDAKILRADRDNVKTLNDYHEIYDTFARQEAQILLGTQMIAKGFDFPNVTVIGVLETDQVLHLPDLRAREKAYQLLLQVIGRTGRGEKPGKAFLQTYEPDHELFKEIIKDDFNSFATGELALRQTFQNPPFWHVSDLIIAANDFREAATCANFMYDVLQGLKDHATVYAPAPTFLKKINNRYHLHILLKYKNSQLMTKNIRKLIEHVVKQYPNVRVYLQVNPLNFH